MKKQLSVDLANRSFGIEEQAYDILHAYIESIQHRFAKENNPDQLLSLFEEQVADFFSEKQRFGMTTIQESEVHQLIEKLGSADAYKLPVEEPEAEEAPFEETSQQESASSGQSTFEQRFHHRRLYRDVNNRMIGGVAAGLSNYLDVDVSIIRIAMLVLCCFTFPVIAAYLVAWLLLKPEPRGQAWEDEPHRFRKKLYRDQRNGVLGGVAAGVSEYFGWKPIWIRLLLLLSAMPWIVLTPFISWFPFLWFGGTIIPIYIVLWVILPAKSIANDEKASTSAPFSTQSSDRMGAEEFAERVNKSNYKGVGQSVSEGFNKGAGCAASGCGCLFFALAVPLLLALLIVIGTAVWGFPISWIHYLRSPEDWFELQPFWMQLMLSASCFGFIAFSGVGILYAMLRVLFNMPPMPTTLRSLYWIFWSISLAILLFCIVIYVMEMISGTTLWPSSIVL